VSEWRFQLVGDQLRERVAELHGQGMTQDEIASQLETSQATVSRIVRELRRRPAAHPPAESRAPFRPQRVREPRNDGGSSGGQEP
jgi:transposase